MIVRLSLLAALCMMSTGAAADTLRWEHLPGLTLAGVLGMQSGDVDGDGYDEVVLTTTSSANEHTLAVVGRVGNDIALRQILQLPGSLTGRITVADIDGTARVLVPMQLEDDYAVIEFGGAPLRELRRLTLPLFTSPVAVADIDADGDLDILAFQATFPYAENPVALLDYDTGATLWTDSAMAFGAAIVAQLDDDPALEIVVPGGPGRVFDGATRLPEWSFPAGFQSSLVSGEFDDTRPGPEFAATSFDYGGTLTLFSTSPYSPLRETTMEFQPGGAVTDDIDGDGRDDILLIARNAHGVHVYTPSSEELGLIPTPDMQAWRLATGNVTGTPAPELIVATAQSYETPDALRVVDPASGETLLAVPETIGPYAALAVGDFDADGQAEVLHALDGRHEDPALRRSLCQLDLRTGAEERCIGMQMGQTAAWVAPVPGRFNDAAGTDLAVVHTTAVRAIDGPTGGLLWMVEPGAPDYEEFSAIVALRFDDDAFDDVAVLGRRIHVLDGRTGADLWRSVELDQEVFGAEKTLTLANVDADPAPEIIATTGHAVYVFDTQTRLLDWSLTPDTEIGRFVTWGSGDACRFALYHPSGSLQTYHCSDRTPDGPAREFPENANFLRVLDAAGKHVLATSAGRVLTIAEDDSVRVWATDLGPRLGNNNSGAIVPLGGDRYDLVVGSDLRVARVAIHIDLVFEDAFE